VYDEDYFGRKTKRSSRMFEMVKVKMFRGEKDRRDQDAAEFLDDVQFLAKRWSEGITDRQERTSEYHSGIPPKFA
jgi:hypothetical protein